jgi:hypothetical protein
MMSKQIKKQVEARAIKKQSQTRELDQEQILGREIQVIQLIQVIQVIQVIQLINQTKRLIHLKTIQIHQQIVQKLVTTVVIKVMKILHP